MTKFAQPSKQQNPTKPAAKQEKRPLPAPHTLDLSAAAHLQRTIGNRLLGQVIQRGKSEEARGEKHRRIEMANKAIPFLQSKVSS
ncbi:MAG: hypothetical protein R6X34_15465, partial [Chloroflexota bacterium]